MLPGGDQTEIGEKVRNFSDILSGNIQQPKLNSCNEVCRPALKGQIQKSENTEGIDFSTCTNLQNILGRSLDKIEIIFLHTRSWENFAI